MRVGLAHRGFRANFRIVDQRKVQLIKVDKPKICGPMPGLPDPILAECPDF